MCIISGSPALDQARQSLTHFFRELHRVGLTSVGDIQNSDITFAHRRILADMARTRELTLRLSYFVASDSSSEAQRLAEEVRQLPQSDMFRFAGFTEMSQLAVGTAKVSSKTHTPALEPAVKSKITRLTVFWARGGYRFRVHAASDDTATQLLDILEETNREISLKDRRIGFAHAADPSTGVLERIAKLGGGIILLNRAVLDEGKNSGSQGEASGPGGLALRKIIDGGLPVGAGTDADRQDHYSPMVALWGLVTGKSAAGILTRDKSQNLTREQALRIYTTGNAWFSFEDGLKGSIEPGKFADLAVLDGDYLTVPEDRIRTLQSVLTLVGGRVVYAAWPFAQLEGR